MVFSSAVSGEIRHFATNAGIYLVKLKRKRKGQMLRFCCTLPMCSYAPPGTSPQPIIKYDEVPHLGVISLCLWGISPSDFASFAHHFASFPHQICFISPTNCFISPTNCFISPTSCFISPTKFSLPHHYFASLCQKLEHNFLIFFPFFFIFGA